MVVQHIPKVKRDIHSVELSEEGGAILHPFTMDPLKISYDWVSNTNTPQRLCASSMLINGIFHHVQLKWSMPAVAATTVDKRKQYEKNSNLAGLLLLAVAVAAWATRLRYNRLPTSNPQSIVIIPAAEQRRALKN